MVKIGICIRNRLSITKKCIQALYKHSTLEFQLYIYNNLTNYKLKEHFEYFWKLYEQGMISQLTFNTEGSTFNAFSKATALNQFGHNHEQDPKKNDFSYLMIMDNDMLVNPGWDTALKEAWDDVEKYQMSNIKVICQHPGGMKNVTVLKDKTFGGYEAVSGRYSGSGFWSIRNNFYRDVGFLDIKPLVGLNKKHDQNYWKLLSRFGKDYILGLKNNMVIDTGGFCGSICNVIGYGGIDSAKSEIIKYKAKEDIIENMSFDEFYNKMRVMNPPKKSKKVS